MGIVSINEPGGHTMMLTPTSLNEPIDIEMPDPPVITSIAPDNCAMGDPDFTLVITGTGFYNASVIYFAGHVEPTTLNEDGTLSTGVKPSLWQNPVVVQVEVYNLSVKSNAVDFTFNAPATRTKAADHEPDDGLADPDDLEDEIDQAAEEGDFKPTRRRKR